MLDKDLVSVTSGEGSGDAEGADWAGISIGIRPPNSGAWKDVGITNETHCVATGFLRPQCD